MVAETGLASIASADEARRFTATFTGAMERLAQALDQESAQLATGRISQALSREGEKTELAGAYLRALELGRRHAVALARLVPDALPGLRSAQAALRVAIERNQAIIATAKAVSEGLVRDLAADVSRRTRPQGYGAQPPSAAAARPLVYSARL